VIYEHGVLAERRRRQRLAIQAEVGAQLGALAQLHDTPRERHAPSADPLLDFTA